MQPVVHMRRQMGQQRRPALPHQCEELRGFQADVARNILEPFRAVARLALRQHQRRLSRSVVALERRLHVLVLSHVGGEFYRVLKRQTGTQPDREMCGVGRVAHQHNVAVVPPGVGQRPEVAPRRAATVRVLSIHQPVAVEVPFEYPLQECDALIRCEPVEAQARPRFRGAFDDTGTRLVVETICVKPDPPATRFDERKGERIEPLAGAQPDVLVPASGDRRSEVAGV